MKIVQNSLLILFALLISLVMTEGLFYLLNKDTSPPKIQVVEGTPNSERLDFFQYHPVYGYSGLPSVSKRFYGKLITHNSKGMRGPEIEYKAADNVKRLAFIGDSQTWGWAVSDDETIPYFASEILNKKLEGITVESLNFGATGYGVDQSYLRYISEGIRYKPDIVVLTYFADNDIWETATSEAWGVEKPFFYEKVSGELCVSNIPPKRASGWPSDNLENKFDFKLLALQIGGFNIDFSKTQAARYFKNRSINSSLFASWGTDNSEPLKAIKNHIGCIEKEPAPEIKEWEDKISLTVNIIDQIKSTAEAQGSKFLVVTKPLEQDYRSGEAGYDYSTVLSRLNTLGITVVDMYSVFKEKGVPPEVAYQGAGHLTMPANWLVAETISLHLLGDISNEHSVASTQQ